MRNRRRSWFLRCVVLGLAVVAIAAPVAQARVDEGASATEEFIAGVTDFPRPVTETGGLLAGDDKVIVETPSLVLAGDDKAAFALVETPSPVLAGDDKVIVETPQAVPVAGPGYSQYGYAHARPGGYAFAPTQLVGDGGGFDWSDAGIGAGLALALLALAAAATLGTRRIGRPASA